MSGDTLESSILEHRMLVGNKVKEYREKRGYSQDGLAAAMQIHRTTISKIENGRFAVTIDVLGRLAKFLRFQIEFTDIS